MKMNDLKNTDINIRDPFVLVHNGRYYLYGTRAATCWGPATGFDVYVSDDLKNWSEAIPCFENDGTFWADQNYWAPEVHEWLGKFYMFASFKADGVCRGTAILRADDPTGPFEPYSDGPVTPVDWECLDGTLYVSRDGRPFLVFCHEWVQVIDGEICAIPLTADLKSAAGDPVLLFKATDLKGVQPSVSSEGVKGFVTDGPFFWRTSDGSLLCLWSAYGPDGYVEALALSDNGEIDGNFRQIKPLYEKDGGHGMVFRATDGQLYLTLHSPNSHGDERPRFLPLEDTGDRLIVRATSSF